MVLDNTKPTQPEYLTRIELYSIVANPIEDGNTLFVADQFFLKAYNMTDPKNPVALSQVSRMGDSRYLNDIVKSGSIIYAIESNSHLSLYDASNPANLTPVSTTAYADIRSLHISGTKLLAASLGTGLRIFDISTPASPTLLGTYNPPGTAYHAIQDGSFAYLADGAAGLQIVDLTDPAAPVLTGTYNTPGTAQQVAKKRQLCVRSRCCPRGNRRRRQSISACLSIYQTSKTFINKAEVIYCGRYYRELLGLLEMFPSFSRGLINFF